MNHLIRLIVLVLGGLIANIVIAASLTIDAQERGINSTCSSYLSQLEESYDLSGLNITLAYPNDPSLYPSMHVSSKKYNNGSSVFSATLSPDGEFCYVSTVNLTLVNTQSCSDISILKLAEDPSLQVTTYAEGDYSIITSQENSYQIIFISNGEQSCMMTETQMLWPGR